MNHWNLQSLYAQPEFHRVGEQDGVMALYYEGEPYLGKPTQVFAYMGIPETDGGPVPGMVLLHGGGGKAFSEWVRLWNDAGYAAIAMDFGGCGPDGKRHGQPGPPQDHTAKFDLSVGWENLWTHHAIAAAVRGHSLLRGQPGVDAARIGVTGISWGGYLTCIVAGVDERLRFAVPVYGCGFLQDNSADDWMTLFARMTPEERARWHLLCDPSVYLQKAAMPLMFVTGTNDFAYPLDSVRKSGDAAPTEVRYCIRLEMPHSHQAGWQPSEIQRYADHMLRGGPDLPRLGHVNTHGIMAAAHLVSDLDLTSACLLYTTDEGRWQERKWRQGEAVLTPGAVCARIPDGASSYLLAVTDERDGLITTPPQILR